MFLTTKHHQTTRNSLQAKQHRKSFLSHSENAEFFREDVRDVADDDEPRG